MTSRGNEVKHGVDSVVPEARVTLNTRLLGQDVVVLSLEVSNDFGKAVKVHSQRQTIGRVSWKRGRT